MTTAHKRNHKIGLLSDNNTMKADAESVKGFLISCDKNREKQALRDAYNFITEYIETIYSDVTEELIRKKIKDDGKEVNLETEIAYTKRADNRLLFQIEANVNCMCFVKINPIYKQIDPCRVVNEIMKDVHENGKEITRYCHRILPVERAFRAQHFRMLDELDELLVIHSQPNEIKSWMLNFKCRNNQKFNYKEVLKETEKLTKKFNHFADIYYPQWAISVEITNHLMCLSICEKFKETNEYKLHKKIDKAKFRDEEEDEKEEREEREEVQRVERVYRRYNQERPTEQHERPPRNTEQPISQPTPNQPPSQEQPEPKPSQLLFQKIQVPKQEEDVDLF